MNSALTVIEYHRVSGGCVPRSSPTVLGVVCHLTRNSAVFWFDPCLHCGFK
jgi:hypothetical protein